MVIIFTDKEGNTLTYITPPDMVVNEKNIKSFISKKLKDAKHSPRRSQEHKSGGGDETFDLGEIDLMVMKYIYGTDPGE